MNMSDAVKKCVQNIKETSPTEYLERLKNQKESPYVRGYNSGGNPMVEAKNPYATNTLSWHEWEEGWLDAKNDSVDWL